jgi:hypothetical protein
VEYSPSCIAGRQFGTQFPSFYGTRPIINGPHQLTTGPFPNQINPFYTSHPLFVRFISMLFIYPPIYVMVVKMFSWISNTTLTNCAKPSRLHVLHRYFRVHNFRLPGRRGDQFFFFFFYGGILYWRVPRVEILSCRTSGAWNFEVAYESFGTFVHPWAVMISYLSLYLLCPLY